MTLCAAAALFVATAIQPVTADDSWCSGTGDEAIAACSRLLALKPENCDYYATRGGAYKAKGDYDRAISDFDQAIRLVPNLGYAYYYRGEAYEAKNDPDRAIADFDRAVKIDFLLAEAYQGRERVRVLLAKRSNPGAEIKAPAR